AYCECVLLFEAGRTPPSCEQRAALRGTLVAAGEALGAELRALADWLGLADVDGMAPLHGPPRG
ncbi:hypothetical protein VQ02_32945, partial [Methylobacterium variabile]